MLSRFISYLFFRFYVPLTSDPCTTEMRLFRVFDSENPSSPGLYHYAPTLDHVAHALGCCTIDNHPGDTLVIQTVARLYGSHIIPVNDRPLILTMNPSYREAQRVLSQAQAAPAAPEVSHG